MQLFSFGAAVFFHPLFYCIAMKTANRSVMFGKVFLAMLCLACPVAMLLSQDDQETTVLREKMDVVNVEIPVRVFYQGQAVDTLTVDDFLLFENDLVQKVNGFYLKKKKMAVQQVDITARQQQLSVMPRFFVLVFQVSNYNDSIKKGVELLFRDIIRDQDRVLVFVNEKSLFLDRGYWQLDRIRLLEGLIKTQSLRARQQLQSYFLAVKQDLDHMKLKIVERSDQFGGEQYAVIDFLNRYLQTWQEYKRRHLLPDMDRYYNFSNYLDRISDEKWVINFYQIEMFPKMKQASDIRKKISELIATLRLARSEDAVHSRMITELLDEIDRQLNVSDDFPSQEIAKLLTKVDATFHTLMMSVELESFSEDLEFKKVSADLENNLRDIATQTGGGLLASNDMGAALQRLSEKEDIYYVLTYRPTPDQQSPKIDIQLRDGVKQKDYRLFYDDQFRADYIHQYIARRKSEQLTLEIRNFSFTQKTMSLEIHSLTGQSPAKGEREAIDVRVILKNMGQQEIYNENKILRPQEDVVRFRLSFPWLPLGRYYAILEVNEAISGRTTLFFEEISVD